LTYGIDQELSFLRENLGKDDQRLITNQKSPMRVTLIAPSCWSWAGVGVRSNGGNKQPTKP